MDKKNLSIIRQSFANAALGHKIQEVAADRKDVAVSTFKRTEIVVVGIILVLFIVQSQTSIGPIFSYIGAGVTAAEILLLIIKQTYHFDEDVVAHKNAAAKYLGLRDRYKSLIADIMTERVSSADIIQQRDVLLHEYQLIVGLTLPTSSQDYDEAMLRMKLTKDEENVWSDRQINHLLPRELRIK